MRRCRCNKVVAENYTIDVLQYNAEKQITKVEATKKDDQSKKTFYFDAEGNEITMMLLGAA